MDFLNFLTKKDEEVLKGTYYNREPKTPTDVGVSFKYDIVDESSRAYAKLLDSLESDRTYQTIKTNDACGFEINGYVATQEGGLWIITNFIRHLAVPDNKQALRFVKRTASTEYVIRLMQVDNPWGLE